jgi:hypothetical protein
MDQSPLQRALAALSNVYQTGKEKVMDTMQAAENRGAVGNITDALKGFATNYTSGIAGLPVDTRNMVSSMLSPEGGGNPYAESIRNLIGKPNPAYGSEDIANHLGIGGEGLAYNLGAVAGPGMVKHLMSPAMLEMMAYHGSPYKFEPTAKNPLGEFDLSKIGTGEGAQAYGHGAYLGGARGTGEAYAKQLGGYNFTPSTPEAQKKLDEIYNLGSGSAQTAKEIIVDAKSPQTAAKNLRDWSQSVPEGPNKRFYEVIADMVENGEIGVQSSGHLYTVDLPDEHVANMLDWDKPLSQQEAYVKAAVQPLLNGAFDVRKYGGGWGSLEPDANAVRDVFTKSGHPLGTYSAQDAEALNFTGSDIVKALGSMNKQSPQISQMLHQAGIPGIKYSDSMSRGGTGGTQNFVVFDPDILNILSREQP